MREMSASCKSLLVVLLVLVLDQCSKYLILQNVSVNDVFPCCSVFNIVHVVNRGVAFGVLNSLHRFILIGLAATVLFGFVFWIKNKSQYWFPGGLIIGGAIGNLIDRCVYGAVIDFLDFHISMYHWPAFNIADSAIVLGIGVLLFWKEEKK